MTEQDEDVRHKVTKFISACIVQPKPNLNWGHVIGAEDAKRELYHHVVLPHKLSESVQRFDERYPTPGDVLIEGPSGSGRTKLAHTVASMVHADFFCVVNLIDIVTNFGIESSLVIRILFETAEKFKRSIIFLRNMDCFEEDCNWIVIPGKTELKHQMEFWKERYKFINGDLKSVTVIGTTRNMRLLDIEIVIRFKSRTLVELPNPKERFQMFQMFFGDACLTLKEKDWKIVVDNTEGLTGGNLKTLCENVISLSTRYEKLRSMKAEPETTCITLAAFSPWICTKTRNSAPIPIPPQNKAGGLAAHRKSTHSNSRDITSYDLHQWQLIA